MSELHEDYYLRKCCIEKNEVPSQSVMRQKMGSALAEVYFKSMSANIKAIAGLEPPLKGGGSNWYISPEDLLKGRAVLRPVQRKFLKKFSCDGIVFFGKEFVNHHRLNMEVRKEEMILKSDENWKKTIVEKKIQEWNAVSAKKRNKNTLKIKQAFHEFSVLYRTSLTKIEDLLKDAAKIELERLKQHTCDEMQKKLEMLKEEQRQQLFEEYKKMLETEKNKCKEKFLHDIHNLRAEHDKNIAAINTEKYTALEKLRTILGYQNIACQVYVALNERAECEKEMEASKREHATCLKLLSEQIDIKDDKISSTMEEIRKQSEINQLWQNKVRHVLRRFQEFVKYCLHRMPEQAKFFINMEKLMLLQLNEILDNPHAENIFETEDEIAQTDATKPNAFFLVCDETSRPQINTDLCQQHPTSSQMPVIVINKRCIYSACDNFKLLGDKLEQYLAGLDINDDVKDEHDYSMDVPIHCTSSEQLLELKLQSTLMQILQDEFLNTRHVVTQCAECGDQYCFCSPRQKNSKEDTQDIKTTKNPAKTLNEMNITKFAREPKVLSYLEYIRPTKCECVMKVKKHLKEHLPAYMKNVSAFEKVDIPQYEPCDVYELKEMVKEAHITQKESGQVTKNLQKTQDAATQYSDKEFEVLCERLSDAEIERLFKALRTLNEGKDKADVIECITLPSRFEKDLETEVFDTARTLDEMIKQSPKLEEIFKRKCA